MYSSSAVCRVWEPAAVSVSALASRPTASANTERRKHQRIRQFDK